MLVIKLTYDENKFDIPGGRIPSQGFWCSGLVELKATEICFLQVSVWLCLVCFGAPLESNVALCSHWASQSRTPWPWVGQTDWREPAMRTAQRETWEESGYKVRTGELLATVRNGFRIYRP